MKRLILIVLIFVSATVSSNEQNLTVEMKKMDKLVFESFNQCLDEKYLNKHKNYFSNDVEFYHDNGGVTWDRASMINNTKKYACGKFTRDLFEESFRVYSVKDFGAITEGVHQFCKVGSGSCDGKAKFIMVWKHADGEWKVTRVISYGHFPN